ncbi:MAG TPA: PEGA domain-containing protein, partial [Candidatus Saccharimonadales bacterium]|nr:PEGA domain-containing protein [Candidatus Saccharimonadales bacterium]
FLDPAKQMRHRVILWVGYVLVAIGIVIAALVLLYQAYGFGIGKNGQVIQNGLVFFSSQPHPAKIYLNGKLNTNQTNARIALPSGIYRVQLQRDGYRQWQRTIEVEGGDVQHFDYPLLVPSKLTSKKLAGFQAAPGLATQSPDQRWLLVQKPGSMTSFSLYDLKNPTKAPVGIDLPDNVLTKAVRQSWQLDEWADDNKHVVLQHNYDGKREFVLVDRTDSSKSQNLDKVLSADPTKLSLINKKYDQYYLYDSGAASLRKATLSAPAPVAVLDHVLNYQSYSDDTLLYATDAGASAGKVLVRLKIGDHQYPVRTFPAGSSYPLNLTEYSGTLYVAVGAASTDKVYIYKDPVGQLRKLPKHALVPSQVLHVSRPNYVSFSNNAQFIMAENGNDFGVYDIENEKGYNYKTTQPLDKPQTHASWIDGDRLTYISGGKVLIFDYDDTNPQTLVPANPLYLPAFAPDFKFIYTLAPNTAKGALPGQTNLNQTSLLIPADQ